MQTNAIGYETWSYSQIFKVLFPKLNEKKYIFCLFCSVCDYLNV